MQFTLPRQNGGMGVVLGGRSGGRDSAGPEPEGDSRKRADTRARARTHVVWQTIRAHKLNGLSSARRRVR